MKKVFVIQRIAIIVLAVCALTSNVQAQEQLAIRDTMTSAIVVNPNFPRAATVVMYSPLNLLLIDSSIEFMAMSYEQQRGEYIITIRPNVAHVLTIDYPGFRTTELRLPPMESGESLAYVVGPPDPFLSGTLVIQPTPRDAMVQVEGVTLGQGNIQVALRPGTYPVRISKQGYDPMEFSVNVAFNETNSQRRTILPAKQPLSVVSNIDGARVFYQGMEIGMTPLEAVMVDQGFAEVRVESPGYTPFEQTIDVRSNRVNRVEATLQTMIQVVRSPSTYVRNEESTINNNMLEIAYDLAIERKRYQVDVVFLGPDNTPIEVTGLSGDVGKKQAPGMSRKIYWPIPESFAMDGVKVQVLAKPQVNPIWFVAGGLGIGGGIAAAALLTGSSGEGTFASGPPGRPVDQ